MREFYPAFPSETAYGSNLGISDRGLFAAMAMQGLLADPEDREDERKYHYEKCDSWDSGSVSAVRVPPERRPAGCTVDGYVKMVFDETCAQAVARIAVEHADALLAALGK